MQLLKKNLHNLQGKTQRCFSVALEKPNQRTVVCDFNCKKGPCFHLSPFRYPTPGTREAPTVSFLSLLSPAVYFNTIRTPCT